MKILMISEMRRKAVQRAVLDAAPEARSALIIDAAGRDKERGGSAAKAYSAAGMRVSVCDPECERLPVLDDYGLVHFSGGDPFRLLRAARKSNLQELLEARAQVAPLLVVGSSAGAMVMADDISHAAILCSAGNDSTTGFGWVRGRVMPHIDRKGPHADMMRAEVARLSDEEWVLLRDDEVRAFPEESPQFDFCA